MSVLDNLITDRTQADVDLVKSLTKKGIPGMTADEMLEFLSSLKGAYNYTDLNRVESAVSYLANELVQAPADLRQYASDRGVAWVDLFDVPYDPDDYYLTTKTDWSNGDIVTSLQMVRYLANIKLIRDAIDGASFATIPDSMDRLTYQLANGIEQLLVDVGQALTALIEQKQGLIRSALAINYSGEIYSGEGEA